MKKLKKLLHFDDGGQVPGQSNTGDQPGQGTSSTNQPGQDTSNTASPQPGQGQTYNSDTGQNASTTTSTPGQTNTAAQQTQSSPYSPAKTGSGFTNIQKLIGANSNNQLGQTVGGGVTNTAQQAANNINQAQSDFTNQSAAANNNTDANRQYIDNTLSTIQNQAIGSATPTNSIDPTVNAFDSGATVNPSSGSTTNTATSTTPSTTNTATNSATTPYQYTAGQYDPTQDVSKFQTFLSGQYTGPTQLNNLTNLQTQSTDVGNLQNSLNSQEGREGLLQRFVGGNTNYTQGEQNLDALLLGQTGGQQLAQARLATQVIPNLTNLSQADQGVAQTYQNQAQDLANYVNYGANGTSSTPTGGIIGTAQNIKNAIGNAATNATATSSADLNNLYNDWQNNTLTPDEVNQINSVLGISNNSPVYGTKSSLASTLFGTATPNSGTNPDGTPMTGDTFSSGVFGTQTYTPDQMATMNQYAAEQALAQLGGVTPDGTNLGGLNINESQIGTAPTSPLSITGAENLASNQKTANTDFSNALSQSPSNLSLPAYQFLNSQNGTDLTGDLGNIYNQVVAADKAAGAAGTLLNPALGGQISPEIQQALGELQNYKNTNNSSVFDNQINSLQGLENSVNTGGLEIQNPIQNILNQIQGLQTAGSDIENNGNYNYFNNLSALLGSGGGPPATSGPGRQVVQK